VRSAADLKEAHPRDHLQGEIANQEHAHLDRFSKMKRGSIVAGNFSSGR
jgi:hypothetical protein